MRLWIRWPFLELEGEPPSNFAEPSIVDARSPAMSLSYGIAAAAVGGAIGHFAFVWIVGWGFYAPMLPGALLGLGFSFGYRQGTTAGAICCAITAVGLGLFSVGRVIIHGGGLLYFLIHPHELTPVTLIMIGLGGLCAYWIVGSSRHAVRPAAVDD